MRGKDFIVLVSGKERWRRDLKKVLVKWVQVQRDYFEHVRMKDVPYRYNERTNVGLLAAAAWLCGFPTLEEFRVKKGTGDEDSWTGRGDLFLHLGETRICVEAKDLRIKCPRKQEGLSEELWPKAGQLLKKARDDANRTLQRKTTKVDERVGIVFVTPFFGPNAGIHWRKLQTKFLKRPGIVKGLEARHLEKTDFLAVYFPDPKNAPFPRTPHGNTYPFVLLLGSTRGASPRKL